MRTSKFENKTEVLILGRIEQLYIETERKIQEENNANKEKKIGVFNERLSKIKSLIKLILEKAETEYSVLYQWIDLNGRKHISWKIGEVYKVNCHIKVYLLSNGNIMLELADHIEPRIMHPESINIDSHFGVHMGYIVTVDLVLRYLEKFATEKFGININPLV